MFNTPTTKPPAFGTTATTFGTSQQTAAGTNTQFGAASTTAPSAGIFGSSSAGSTATTGMFGGLSATTQSTGSVGGQNASQSSGLFSGSMAPKTNASISGGSLPAGNTFGSTSLFSGYMAPAKPPLSFAPQNPKSGGLTFGTSTPATQTSTTASAPPAFGSPFSTQTGFSVQETSTTSQPQFSFNSSTTAASSAGTLPQASTVTFGGVAPQARPPGMLSAMPSVALALGAKPATTIPTTTTGAGIKLGTGTPQATGFMSGTSQGLTPQMTATTLQSTGTTSTSQTAGGGFKLGSAPTTSTTQLSSTAGTTATTSAATGFTFGPTQAKTQTTTQPVQSLSLNQSTTGFNFSGQLGGQAKTTAPTSSATTATKPVVAGNTNLVFAAKIKPTIPGSTPLQTTTSTTKPTLGLALPQTSTTTSTTGTGMLRLIYTINMLCLQHERPCCIEYTNTSAQRERLYIQHDTAASVVNNL